MICNANTLLTANVASIEHTIASTVGSVYEYKLSSSSESHPTDTDPPNPAIVAPMLPFLPFPATSRSSEHCAGNPMRDSDRMFTMVGTMFGI